VFGCMQVFFMCRCMNGDIDMDGWMDDFLFVFIGRYWELSLSLPPELW
jgi:hypothetical protein